MNENQKAFLEALKEMGGSATLFELKLAGKEFKSGSINVLKAKGYVTVSEDKDDRVFECDVVYNGVKVGSVKVTAKVYELVNAD
jgi:hypothetical protein